MEYNGLNNNILILKIEYLSISLIRIFSLEILLNFLIDFGVTFFSNTTIVYLFTIF